MRHRIFREVDLFTVLVCLSSVAVTVAESIPQQPGHDIVCTGPQFTYQHDVRQHGVDTNLTISGDAGFRVETAAPSALASYYTDTSKGGSPAIFQYSFVAEPGSVFDTISVASLARIFGNACSVIGEYKIGDGNWINFFSLTTLAILRPVDVFENVHDSRFTVRYTVSWINAYYADSVQLFRSWSSAPGQPGDYAFMFSASLITDIMCDRADIAGDDRFVDVADFTTLSADYGEAGTGLTGDINNDGSCDIDDLRWLAGKWLCNCYERP